MYNELPIGTVVLIKRKNENRFNNETNYIFAIVMQFKEGDSVESSHGSPSIETILTAKNTLSSNVDTYSSEDYYWYNAQEYITILEEKIDKIKEFVKFI